MTEMEEREKFLSVRHVFLMHTKMRSSWLMALALWWHEQPNPFFSQRCVPRATGSLVPASTRACRAVLLQKAARTAGKTRGSPGQVQKFTFLVGEEVQTHNSHMPIHQHNKENFSRTLIAQNIWGFLRGFCLWFSREFFSSFLVGKLMPLIL